MAALKLLDVIANTVPIPLNRLTLVEPNYQRIQCLPVGQIGTIVEIYDTDEAYYLVEFADSRGREYAMATLQADEVLAINFELSVAS